MLTLLALLLLAPPACPQPMVARYWPQPVYPKKAVKEHRGGKVRLEAVVATDGHVRSVATIDGDPDFADLADDALKQWQFQPCLVNGRAVEATASIDFSFHADTWEVTNSADLPPWPRGGTHRVILPGAAAAGHVRHRVKPDYPLKASFLRRQGEIVLHLLVGRDGGVRLLRTEPGPPELVRAAEDAVRQWRYEPYLLNGEAVEVETEVSVKFTVRD